ncbi:MAG: TolB family protein, partial [Gaiellaceae bacterium]
LMPKGVEHGTRNTMPHPFIRCPYHAEWCGDILSLAWARDGTRIAFSVTSYGGTAQFNGLHIVSLKTRQDFWTLLSDPRTGGPSNLEWAPDGSKVVFDASGSIYVLSVHGWRMRRLRTGTPDGAFDYSPSWSADGTRLVFATKRHQHSSISVIDLDGSHRRLIATHANAPAWSPDGKTIAYRTPCGIKMVTPGGKDVTPTNPPFVCHAIGLAGDPVWSPDGRRIAILGAPSFTPATFVIDANGRHLTVLTHATGRAVAPGFRDASWQPQPKI